MGLEGLFNLREGVTDIGKYEALPRAKKIQTTDGSGLYRVSMSSFPRLRLIWNQRQAIALADQLQDLVFD
ncbi:hypothetical protein HMPREF2875_06420 [Corynebacterium sp. HMSC078H07]|nr:hypothetical protein HMPREF2875_06420 [Corynebacterium sp. HMSC078H07]